MKKNINAKKVLKFIKENHLSKQDFCSMCGFSANTLHKILYEKNDNISMDNFLKLVGVMNVSSDEILLKRRDNENQPK